MGGRESRCLPWALADKWKKAEGHTDVSQEDNKKTETQPPLRERDPPEVNSKLLELAEKISEEVLAQALLLCWEAEIRYQELPFIDIQCEYVI